ACPVAGSTPRPRRHAPSTCGRRSTTPGSCPALLPCGTSRISKGAVSACSVPTGGGATQPSVGYSNAMSMAVSSVNRPLEAAIHRIERLRPLDALGRAAAIAVYRVVRAGPLKDILSGTWLGHPLHPVLTDVPIGAWSSAFVLDLLGPGSEKA